MLFKDTINLKTFNILQQVLKIPSLGHFSLAGGTALALQIGHRKSVDLDFFTLIDFDVTETLELLEQEFKFELDYSANNTLKGSINSIKVDFISHKYPLVDIIENKEGIRLYSQKDIAAMKINAICNSGTRPKDFIDIYFLLKKFNSKEIISFYQKKYNQRNTFHALKSLTYFDDLQSYDWPELINEPDLSLAQLKQSITRSIKDNNL